MLNLMSTVCWPPYKTGCYLNQERGTRHGCITFIHIRIRVKNPFHKVLTNRPCYLLRRPSWKSACSKLVLRPFSSSRHPLFWILMGITGVNPFLVPRFSLKMSVFFQWASVACEYMRAAMRLAPLINHQKDERRKNALMRTRLRSIWKMSSSRRCAHSDCVALW